MNLQNVLWPKAGVCMDEELYFHKDKKTHLIVGEKENYFCMDEHAMVYSDTYFNGFSIEKWLKYTKIKNVKVCLKVEGKLNISICVVQKINDSFVRKVLEKRTVISDSMQEVVMEFKDATKGMLYYQMEALSDNAKFYGGYYLSDVEEKDIDQVKLGIVICTFKREKYILHNIDLVKKNIIDNPQSSLYKKLKMFISDNGKTLDAESIRSKDIHIVQNKNAGGAGGFTRGLIEILKSKEDITHVLLMDDDIVIDTDSIIKTATILSLLKAEYKDAFIGGAMLRSDQQNIQVESGASWNAGRLISLKANLDLRRWEDCLFNEIEEYSEFNAWWYCCFPMSIVTKDNLPLPIFIRGDDLEYGLRNMKTLILMNGICVWHEPFENKYSSFLEYYIIRNRIIDNACHFPWWGKKQLIDELVRQFLHEGFLYRYKNIDLYIRGISDFLKGIDWLEQQDGEVLHKEIMSSGYKAVPIEQLDVHFDYRQYERGRKEKHSRLHEVIRKCTLNGYLLPAKHIRIVPMVQARTEFVWRAKKILFYDPVEKKGFVTERNFKTFVSQGINVLKLIVEIEFKYNARKKEFVSRIGELRNITFWEKYLEI